VVKGLCRGGSGKEREHQEKAWEPAVRECESETDTAGENGS
jgi:hypothetical protein